MKICILDDDIELGKALKIHLQEKGYAVDVFSDEVKGQKHLLMNHRDYNLIILDWMMPKITGLAICVKLRESEITIPILMLSALDALANKVTVFDAGADDYITKPFLIPDLLARIRALLRRPKESVPTTLLVGNISLNTSTHKVLLDNKEVPLTLKEFSILEYLMLHQNQVVKREILLDNVWDINFVSFSNVIDVRINGLRNKLGAKGKNIIKTVRGVGYKLETGR